MSSILPLLAIAVFVVAWHRLLHRTSGGRVWSPLWGAFTATFVSILFLVAGVVGYKLDHGVPFTIPSAWSGEVIWRQILVAIGAAIVAVFLWRAGLRSIHKELAAGTRQRSGGPTA